MKELQEQLSEAKRTIQAIRDGHPDPAGSGLAAGGRAEEPRQRLVEACQGAELLSAVIDSIDDEIWFADTRKRFTLMNLSALHGFDLASAGGIEVEKLAASLEVYRPDGSPRPIEEAPPLRALKGESVKNLEEIIRLPVSGELQHRQVSAAPVRDAAGNILGSVSVVRDITDRKKNEEALQKSHEQMRWLDRFPEENPNPVVRVSAEGKILYRNEAAAEVPGWTWTIGQAVPDSLLAPLKQAVIETRVVKLDLELGERIYSVSLVPFPAESYVHVYGIDITERKRVETEILNRAAQLQATFEAMSDTVLIYDSGMTVQRVTPSFLTEYGFDPVGLYLSEIMSRVSCRQLDGRPLVLADQPTPWALRGKRVAGACFQVTRADGSEAVVETSSGPIRVEDRIIGSVTVWHDITKSKSAEEEVRRSEARFRLLSETAGRLLASRNPQKIVNELCQQVMEHLGCHTFFNFLVDEPTGKLHLNAWGGIPEEEAQKIEWLDYGVAVCGCVARDGARIVAEDIFNTRDVRTELVKSYGIQAYACHPLRVEGRLIGTLSFGTKTRTGFSPQELEIMRTIADQVAIAMERIRLIEELQRSRDELEIHVQERTGELLRANEVLQEQANLLDLAHDAIFVRDLHDRVVYWNRGAEKTYGWSQDEAQGKVTHDLLQTRFPAPLDEIRAELLEAGEWEGELHHIARDGSPIIVESRHALQRNLDGEPTGVLQINRDITKRKEAEERLRHLAAIVESSDDAIISKTLEGHILSWNKAAERIYGYAFEEVAGQSVSLLASHDRWDELPELLAKLKSGDSIAHYETVRVRKDGTCIPVSLAISPVKDAEGRIVGASTVARDITERRRAEEQLHQASQYARSLIEASLDPLVTISPEGKITDTNEATIKVTGVAREGLIGSDFSNYFTEPEKATEGYRQVFEKGFVTDYPLTIRHKDGGLVEVLYNASVYKDTHGKVLGVFAAARDITERKRAEEKLRQASQYSRSLIEASLDPLVTISPEGKITDINEATIKVTGVPREGLIGSDFSKYYTEPEKATEGYRKVFEKGFVTDYALTIRHKDGSLAEVLYNASVYKDTRGNVLGVFAAARDITQRKLAEEKVNQAKILLQSVFDGISEPLMMVEKDLRVKVLNQAALRYFQVNTTDEAIERTCYDLTNGRCQHCDQCALNLAISKGKTASFERRGLFDPDHIEQVTVYPLDEATGEISGAIIRISDLTETRKLEQHMTRVDRLSSLGQLSAGIAHEIRNPLAGINLFVDVLTDEEKFQRTDLELEILGEIKQNIKKMDGIIKRVLDFARQSESPIQDKLDAGQLINQTVNLWRSAMTKAGIVLHLSVEKNLPGLHGDAIELQQVLNNLLENAFDAMGQGGSLNLTARQGVFSLDENRQALIIALQDTGSGIPAEHRGSIFNPFFTTKPTGTGLGLAISHRIVSRHGGTIFCESTTATGTTFRMEFPIASGE